LNADQWVIVDQIINLKPRDYGVNTPYDGDLEPVPADLVQVSGQYYAGHGVRKTLGDNPEDFKDTVEYARLRRHGGEFSFYESWPEGNEFGMRAEPWHWQYRSS